MHGWTAEKSLPCTLYLVPKNKQQFDVVCISVFLFEGKHFCFS